MKQLIKQIKAQSLPLNTIVIAILVIIVLLVIVLFFTGKIGETSGTIDETTAGIRDCSLENTVLTGYIDIKEEATSCPSEASRIPGMDVEEGNVCCGYK